MVYALVVVYNKKCQDSPSLVRLLQENKNINIIVYDNSSIDYGNKNFCKKHGIMYYTQNKNLGLSKANNFVVNKIKKNEKNYLLILDDDTDLPNDYFDEIYKEIQNNTFDILLPIVMSNNQIISPCNVQFNCRIKKVKEINTIDLKKITAINSGMVVKTSIYNTIKYNEKLFLDYVDHDFMKNIRLTNYKIKIMNTVIYQNFSRNTKNSIESEIFRFNIYLKDFKKYCKDCNNLKFYYVSSLKYRINEVCKYKNLRFLK